VYDLQPLDQSLPSAVISVKSHPHDKAKDDHVRHLRDLRQDCAGSGFLAVAFCADGDTAYSSLLNPIDQNIHGAKDWSFGDFVNGMEEPAHPEPFVTDFLHQI
jgi:hypothetical protein